MIRLSTLLLCLLVLISCNGGSKARYDTGIVYPMSPGIVASEHWAEMGYEIASPPPGALPEVSAEMGGDGFEEIAASQGWQTRSDPPRDTDPDALVGGRIRYHLSEYPATLRTEGKDSQTAFQRIIMWACYEPLLRVNKVDLEYDPALATHWKIIKRDDGSQELWFRLDPDARWQTGQRITAEDVVASWRKKVDDGLLALGDAIQFRQFSEPEVVSPYIFRTTTEKQSWKQFMLFASQLYLYPAHIIGELSGKEYMDRFQNAPVPGSGRYLIRLDDVRQGNSITMTRVRDYWDRDNPLRKGEYNFEQVKFVVVSEENLAREQTKKGELDFYYVTQAKYWVRELTPERVEQVGKGWLRKLRVFNDQATGLQGFVFNTREAPFDDVRVRQAFCLLVDRVTLIDKLFFNQYYHQDSFYPGSSYECPDNPKVRYSPEKAVRLLEEAGWDRLDQDGTRINANGDRLEIDLMIGEGISTERIHTVIREGLLKGGIRLNLTTTTFATRIKMLEDRNFKIYYGAWTGSNFPDPEYTWHSKYADGPDTGNDSGFRNAVVDSLIELYEVTYDLEHRTRLLQAIDYRLTTSYVCALAWYGPYSRFVYWDKFGMPDWVLPRTGDRRDIIRTWWYDPDRHTRLREAIAADRALDPGDEDVNYWVD